MDNKISKCQIPKTLIFPPWINSYRSRVECGRSLIDCYFTTCKMDSLTWRRLLSCVFISVWISGFLLCINDVLSRHTSKCNKDTECRKTEIRSCFHFRVNNNDFFNILLDHSVFVYARERAIQNTVNWLTSFWHEFQNAHKHSAAAVADSVFASLFSRRRK